MGQNYSYAQPSSSDEYDLTSLLEAEAALYAEEAESSYNIGEPVQCPPQPFQYLCGGHTNAEEMRAFETQLSLLKDQVQGSRRTGAMSSFSFDYCFVAEVTAFNLKEDKLYLPVGATSSTALHKQCKETILVNKEGNSWNVSLRFSESGGKYYITRGWRKFCLDNRCEIGDLFAFNVVGDGKTTPLMCVCPERKECSEILSKYLSRTSGESSLGGHS
uniref:TF-B3 domain-containing protein n=1 Tax=Brassica campestris TaxID=3711 RepID=M4ER79_BRACM